MILLRMNAAQIWDETAKMVLGNLWFHLFDVFHTFQAAEGVEQV